jgi:hypothetical protein
MDERDFHIRRSSLIFKEFRTITKRLAQKCVCMYVYACFIIGFMKVGRKLNIFQDTQGNCYHCGLGEAPGKVKLVSFLKCLIKRVRTDVLRSA